MKELLSKQESINLINTLLQNSHNQLFIEKIIDKNIQRIGQGFFNILEEAIEDAQYENKDESADFLIDLGERLFSILNTNELDDFIEESLETLYNMDDIDDFIEDNREYFSETYIHSILAEIEHIAIDYGKIETAFYLLDRVEYLVKRVDKTKPYLGFICMSRVNILNDYARYSEALKYINIAIKYFKENSYEIAEALSTKGEILEDIELIKNANRLFHKLRRDKRIHCDSLVQNYKILGMLYQQKGNFYRASKYLNLAMDLSEKSDNELFLEVKLELLLDYATLKIQEGFYSEASNYFYYIYVISKKFNYHKMMYESLYNLANIFMIIGDFEEARIYIIKASDINNQIDRELELAYCYYVLGVIELNIWKKNSKTKNLRKSIVSFNRAIKLLKKSEDNKLYSEILYELGVICKEQGYFEKSINYFNSSLILTKSNNYKSYIYSELALLYASIDQYEEAFDYLHKADMLIDNRMKKERVEFYVTQSKVYFMKGSLHKALNSAFEAIKLYEEIAKTMSDRKMVYFGDKSDIFIFFISISFELQKYKIAFETLEKAKSKYFLEILHRRNVNPINNSLDYEDLVSKIEKSDDFEEIFKLRKKLGKILDIKDVDMTHLGFGDVKRLL